jgi:hypothetical protein
MYMYNATSREASTISTIAVTLNVTVSIYVIHFRLFVNTNERASIHTDGSGDRRIRI